MWRPSVPTYCILTKTAITRIMQWWKYHPIFAMWKEAVLAICSTHNCSSTKALHYLYCHNRRGGLVSALKKHIPSLDTTALLRLRRHIMKHCTKSIRVNSITPKKEHFLHTFVQTLHHYRLSNKIIPLVRDTLAFRTLPKKSFSAKLFALVLIVLLVSAYSFMKTPFGVCNWH